MTPAGERDDARFETEALRWLPEVARFAPSLARDKAAAPIHLSAHRAGLDESFASTEVPDAVGAAAAVLALSIGTVRSRLFRGRRLLQESLLAHARDAGIGVRPGESGPERSPR